MGFNLRGPLCILLLAALWLVSNVDASLAGEPLELVSQP
jgi:hypothetical protein